MNEEYNRKYSKLLNDNMKKYEISGVLTDFFDKMKLQVVTVSITDKEVWGVYMNKEKDFEHNYKILSEFISDVDEFLRLLDKGSYCCGNNEYNFMEFIKGANNIDDDGEEIKLGYRYFESMGEDLFFVYNEQEVTNAIGCW